MACRRPAGLCRVWLVAALAAVSAGAAVVPRPLPGTRAQAATLIVQGIEGGSLSFAVLASSGKAETRVDSEGTARLRLPVAFEIPGGAIDAATLEFYVYAITGTGAVAAHLAAALDLEPGQLAAGVGARVIGTLDLPPGTYSLRFLVLEPVSHRFGLRLLEVDLPGAGQPAALTPPTIADACAQWIVAAMPQAPPLDAAAVPVLVRGTRIELSSTLMGGGSERPGSTRRATVHLTPTRAEDSTAHALVAEVAGDKRFAIGFDLPPIARGVYRLALELEHGAGALTSPATEVWVVDAADLDPATEGPCARTWSAVVAGSSERGGTGPRLSVRGAPGADPDDPESRLERVKLRQAYLGVLARLAASGDFAAGSEALSDVEHRLGKFRSGPQTLLRNELEVAKRLAALEPEVLAPLMFLHHEAYLTHFRSERYPLAGHSSRAVRALGELVAHRQPPEETLALASRILTSLAEYGHRNRMFVPSQLMLQQALEMEPGNQEALLLLAVNYEWFGRYEEVSRLLERLVSTAATHTEARLRLGIMRMRTGDLSSAEQDFQLLLRERPAPWLLSLTYQALAELLRRQERHDEAVEVLRRGRMRLRSDQRLHLLSAHALDRAGRPAEARRLLEELPIDGSSRTPRFRYGESLTSPLDSMRAEIARSVAVRLPLLARALESEISR